MLTRRTLVLTPVLAPCWTTLWAQSRSPRVVRIGWLVPDVPVPGDTYRQFVGRAAELGYTEGSNLLIDYRSFQSLDEGKVAATALVQLRVDVLIAQSPSALLAARHATKTIPIITFFVGDPVRMGVVRSLARPGGNVTGFTWDTGSAGTGKVLQMVRELLPNATKVGLLWNVENDSHPFYVQEFEAHARTLKLSIQSIGVRRADEFEPALQRMRADKTDAAILFPDPFTVRYRDDLQIALARQPIPAIWGSIAWPLHGAVITFGANVSDQPRQAAEYMDRILKGASASELPFQQPSRSDLAIDLGAARVLGVTVPHSLLVRADSVIGQEKR